MMSDDEKDGLRKNSKKDLLNGDSGFKMVPTESNIFNLMENRYFFCLYASFLKIAGYTGEKDEELFARRNCQNPEYLEAFVNYVNGKNISVSAAPIVGTFNMNDAMQAATISLTGKLEE